MASFNPIPQTGLLNQIFYLTNVRIQVFGWPAQGYTVNLIQLIILLALAVVVVAVTESLTHNKLGGFAVGMVLTVIGALLIESLTTHIPDFMFEGIRVLSSLLGAIIVGVFYVLIRGQFAQPSAPKHH